MAEYNQEIQVLVAEDDPDDRLLIKIAFEELQKNIHLNFAHNGEELLQFLGGRKTNPKTLPEIILLDLNMPKITGLQALEKIKGQPEFNAIKIAVLTTSNQKSDKDFCKAHGVHLFFSKPDNFQSLRRIIQLITNHENSE